MEQKEENNFQPMLWIKNPQQEEIIKKYMPEPETAIMLVEEGKAVQDEHQVY